MDASLILCLALTGVGLVQIGLMLVHAWEHRRFHNRRRSQPLTTHSHLRVALIAPCKGLDADLEQNLRALFRQRHPQYELHFVVESENDPALPVIREAARENPAIPCQITLAGLALGCGQKVHNLICATRAVLNSPLAPEILAFVDSDACPHPDWLGRLVEKIAAGKHSVATGYRWYVPVSNRFANRLLSAINNAVIGVMGPHGFNLVWGGAWAIRRDDFEKLGLPQAWRGTLSDDLVVSRLVHQAGLRVGYEPHCLVKSSAEFDGWKLAEFLRRQFVVCRVYAPSWWHLAFWSGFVSNGSLAGLTALALWGVAAGAPRTALGAGAGAALIWVLGAFRTHLAAIAVRPYIAVTDAQYDSVARVSFWGWPLVSLVSWLGAASAAVGRTITWRGIRYRLDSAGHTTILEQSATKEDAKQLHERDSHARTTTRAA